MPKKIRWIIFFAVIVAACFTLWYLVSKHNFYQIKTATEKDNFKWGIGFDPYPNAVHEQKNFDRVVQETKKLGVKWLRFGVPDWDDESLTFTTDMVNKCSAAGFKLTLIFQPSTEYEKIADPYQDGFNMAYKIASKYPQVEYFQLGNEPGSGAIKEGWPGTSEQSFDPDRYQAVLSWLRGASDGIKKANPNAKRVITGHWLHFGFFQMLNKDNLQYEVIGWDWHQESPDLTKIESQGQVYNLIDTLKSLNKELWITEADLYMGSQEGEEAQADYINKLADQTYHSGIFSGFFVFTLFDGIPKEDQTQNNLGIMKLYQDSGGSWQLGGPKKAYDDFKELLTKLQN